MGCREVLPKRSLIRIVRGPEGVKIDMSGKAPGRGAYVHDSGACWQAALNGETLQSSGACGESESHSQERPIRTFSE
ncbi:MAG: YlxR family protein [Anaerolineales bacterium]